MDELPVIELVIALQDLEKSEESLEKLTLSFATQLLELVEQLDRVHAADLPEDSHFLAKGNGPEPGFLDIKVNFSNLRELIGFLYERLTGTSVETTIHYKPDNGEVSISYKGNSKKDRASFMQDAARFISQVELLARSKNG